MNKKQNKRKGNRIQAENVPTLELWNRVHFLSSLMQEEERRLVLLESKNGSLLTQCAAIISADVVILTILLQHGGSIACMFFSPVLIWLGCSLLCSGFAFGSSVRAFHIHKYTYMRIDPNTIDHKVPAESLLVELIDDFHKSISKNIGTNNQKATQIIQSNRFLIAGLVFLVLLGMTMVMSLFFSAA